MFKVLIVDDEAGYRDNLALSLERTPAVVRTASTGREAVEIGVDFRPDVLVIDWMLKHHVHGLQVADALRVVWPSFHTVLITGFPSQDLVNESKRFGVSDFLEKPFDVARFRAAVEKASTAELPPAGRPTTAVALLEPTGMVRYYNARARELFAWTAAGKPPTNFLRLFPDDKRLDLDAACSKAIDVDPLGATVDGVTRPLAWRLEARRLQEGRSILVAFQPREEARPRGWCASVRLLLGREVERSPWTDSAHVLVVSEGELVRRVIVETLTAAGCITFSATDPEEGMRQFLRNPQIQVVILDTIEIRPKLVQFVTDLRAFRPGTQIIGSCDCDDPAEMSSLEADHFLPRYWQIEDLIRVLE